MTLAVDSVIARHHIDDIVAALTPLVTDEHPLMEFFAHQGGNMNDADIAPLLELEQGAFDWLPGAGDEWRRRLEHENTALRLYAESTVNRNPGAGVRAARETRATEFFLYPMGCTSAQTAVLRSADPGMPRNAAASRLQRCQSLQDR